MEGNRMYVTQVRMRIHLRNFRPAAAITTPFWYDDDSLLKPRTPSCSLGTRSSLTYRDLVDDYWVEIVALSKEFQAMSPINPELVERS